MPLKCYTLETNKQQDGPAAANYDEDLGPVALTEWYYTPGFTINEQAQLSRTGPPSPDIILVNGKHKSATGTGEYYKMTVKKVSKRNNFPLQG